MVMQIKLIVVVVVVVVDSKSSRSWLICSLVSLTKDRENEFPFYGPRFYDRLKFFGRV